MLYRTACRWWKEIEDLMAIGASTGKVEADNTTIKQSKAPHPGTGTPGNYKSDPHGQCRQDGCTAYSKKSVSHEPRRA